MKSENLWSLFLSIKMGYNAINTIKNIISFGLFKNLVDLLI